MQPVYNGDVYVIEVNPRSSRTVPYISKVTGVPMVDIATRVKRWYPSFSNFSAISSTSIWSLSLTVSSRLPSSLWLS